MMGNTILEEYSCRPDFREVHTDWRAASFHAASTLRLYDDHTFCERTILTSSALIPSVLSHLRTGAETRSRVLAEKALALAASKEVWGAAANTLPAAIVELLCLRDVRKGPRPDSSTKLLRCEQVAAIVESGWPHFVILGLPLKMPSPLKSRGSLPDLGEVATLFRLHVIVAAVRILQRRAGNRSGAASPGATMTILRDAHRYRDAIGSHLLASEIEAYGDALELWNRLAGTAAQLRLVRYEEVPLPPRRAGYYEVRRQELRERFAALNAAIARVRSMDELLQRVAACDPSGVIAPLIDALLFSRVVPGLVPRWVHEDKLIEYQQLMRTLFESRTNGTDESRRLQVLLGAIHGAIDYRAAYEANTGELNPARFDDVQAAFPGSVRLSIHAKHGMSLQFPVSASPTFNKTPWHGCCGLVQRADGSLRIRIAPAIWYEANGFLPVMFSDDDDLDGSGSGGCPPYSSMSHDLLTLRRALLRNPERQPFFYVDHRARGAVTASGGRLAISRLLERLKP
jgi:hypothetical protein